MTSIDAAGADAGHRTAGQKSDATRRARAEAALARKRDKLFRAARRHTFFVRVLRVLLPVIVLGSFGYYGLVLRTQFSVGEGTLRPGKIEITSEDLKMKNPSYFGVTKENGKYEVRAREAAVDFSMTGPVKLEGIEGDLTQANGVRTYLRSVRGALDNKKGELELFDGVEIDATNGMKAWLKRAMVYTKDHRVVSKDPVSAEMPTGTLTANSMEFSTETRVGQFRGNVGLRLIQTPTSTGTKANIGLGGDTRQPVDIHADKFDIDDLKSRAVFVGNVLAHQGETQLTSQELHVTYEGHASADMAGTPPPAAAPSANGAPPEAPSGTQLKLLTARTGVVLTAGTDRRITADTLDVDVKADTALFTGNVELTQAKNVFHGGRLAVDRKTGKSLLNTPPATPRGAPGRIVATLVQSAPADPKAAAAAKLKTAAAAAADATNNPFGGFKNDPNAPTDIDAESLEVNDQAKQAIFRGKVVAKQGDYVIQTSELIAFYTGQTGLMSGTTPNGETQPKGAGVGGAQLSHIETRGGTKIVTKDGQEAEGGTAHFDLKSNTVTMAGPDGVVLKQGQNYTRGARLKMDLTKGEAHVEQDANAAQTATAAPTPAQLSIAAKPGVAPPVPTMACPTGGKQTCVLIYPNQLKQAVEQKQKGAAAPAAAAAAPPAAAAKPKPDAWQPQSSPSQVYRSN